MALVILLNIVLSILYNNMSCIHYAIYILHGCGHLKVTQGTIFRTLKYTGPGMAMECKKWWF